MTKDERAKAFQDFAVMRLEGRSDIVYRAYDLLTTEREMMPVEHYIKMAGLYVHGVPARETLITLQRRFMSWGFPVMPLLKVEELLHEFWVWDRITHRSKRKWPYRDPDEARKLYEQNERVKALMEQVSSKPE